MKNKLLLFLVAVLASFTLFSTVSFADMTSSDIYELNNATPGTSKVSDNNVGKGLGNLLKGAELSGVYGTVNDAVGNITATSPTTTIGTSHLILWTVPTSAYSFVLPNGTAGQTLTIIKVNSGTTAGKISPTTKTGFTDITLTNQGEGVTLEYVNDTIGWMPKGFFGGSTSVVPKVNQ